MRLLKSVFVFLVLINSSISFGVWNSAEIDKNNYSFVFRFETEMVCTATLLTKTIAITAAHCFLDFNITTNKKFRAIAVNNQDVGLVRFKKIIFHSNYDMNELKDGTLPVEKSGFDIALIILSDNDEYVNNSTTAFLDHYSLPVTPPSLTITDFLYGLGMGSTDDNGNLGELGAAVLKNSPGVDSFSPVLKFNNGKAQQSMCAGDSGGPIIRIHKGVLQLLGNLSGKVSTRTGSDAKNARSCEDDQHVFYVTNFYLHRDWINSVISASSLISD